MKRYVYRLVKALADDPRADGVGGVPSDELAAAAGLLPGEDGIGRTRDELYEVTGPRLGFPDPHKDVLFEAIDVNDRVPKYYRRKRFSEFVAALETDLRQEGGGGIAVGDTTE